DVVPPILEGAMTWRVYNDGLLNVNYGFEKDTEGPFLPRIGLTMILPKAFESVNYYCSRPFSCHTDKGETNYLDYFETTVTDNGGNHIKPQETGNHNGTTYANISSDQHQIVVSSEQPFSFNVTHYTLEELTHTTHKDELVEGD